MSEDKRISLRVSPEEFWALDAKRQTERTTFQSLGMSLFRAWFRGEIHGEKTPVQFPGLFDGLSDIDQSTLLSLAAILRASPQGPTFQILRKVLEVAEKEFVSSQAPSNIQSKRKIR
jgi:hypothetical protein